MVQLPFFPEYTFDIAEVISQISIAKNIDGFSHVDNLKPNLVSPTTLKPPTAAGIAGLIKYYGIET